MQASASIYPRMQCMGRCWIKCSKLQEVLHSVGVCLDQTGSVIKQAQITSLADCNGLLALHAMHMRCKDAADFCMDVVAMSWHDEQ